MTCCGGSSDGNSDRGDTGNGYINFTFLGNQYEYARSQRASIFTTFTSITAYQNDATNILTIHFPFKEVMAADQSLWDDMSTIQGLSNSNCFYLDYYVQAGSKTYVSHSSLKDDGAQLQVTLTEHGHDLGDTISGTFTVTIFKAARQPGMSEFDIVDATPYSMTCTFGFPVTKRDPLIGVHDLTADYTTLLGNITGELVVVEIEADQYWYNMIQQGIALDQLYIGLRYAQPNLRPSFSTLLYSRSASMMAPSIFNGPPL